MRTVTLFGLLIIAFSIGAQTGYEMSDKHHYMAGYILIASVIFDVVDGFRK